MGIKDSVKKSNLIYKPYLNVVRHLRKSKELKLIINPIKKAKKDNPRIAFLLLTPVHGNLGDHAIAEAEKEMMTELTIPIFEISGKDLFLLEANNRLSIFNKSPILVSGGGFLGTLWYHDERLVRNIIIANPDSDILLFPNTIVYEDSLFGQEEFKKAKEIYHSHNHLNIYVREKMSLQLANDLCKNVNLSPDMAMMLREDNNSGTRHGCSLFLRKDKECTISTEDEAIVKNWAKQLFGENFREYDTVLEYGVSFENRKNELNKLFCIYRNSELVITDRLHGMIFGAITGTPTIVLNSKSHKVFGCYEWLKHLEYIKICETPSLIGKIFKTMPHGNQKYDNLSILESFIKLKQDLQAMSKEK